MDENPTFPSAADVKPSKKKTIWLVVIILALIASNTGWALFFFKQQGELNAKISILTVQVAKLKKDNKDLQDEVDKAGDSESNGDYRDIPELGVKYKLDDKTDSVTYEYSFLENTPAVILRTTDIFKIANDNNKDANDLPAPIISKLTEAETKTFKFLDEDFATYQKSSPDSVKKIGQFYYVYTGPNGLDAGKTEEAIAAASKGVLKDVFNSLKAIQ